MSERRHPFEPFFPDWPDDELRSLLEQHKAIEKLCRENNELEQAQAEREKAERLEELLAERQQHAQDLSNLWGSDLSG